MENHRRNQQCQNVSSELDVQNQCHAERERQKERRQIYKMLLKPLFFLDVSGAGDRIYWNHPAVNLDNVVTGGQGA